MILRLTSACIGLLLLAACSVGDGLLESGMTISVNDRGPAPKQTGQFPPRFASLVADESVPALILTVESRNVSGRLLLESRYNGVETWLSSDLSAVLLENGMLQGTRALGSQLFAAELSEPMALILAGKRGYSDRLHSNLNRDDRIVTRTFRCLVEPQGSSEISLEIGTIRTRVMTEDCKSLDQSFRNTYWVNTTSGVIVKARQWSGDELGYVVTQAAVR